MFREIPSLILSTGSADLSKFPVIDTKIFNMPLSMPFKSVHSLTGARNSSRHAVFTGLLAGGSACCAGVLPSEKRQCTQGHPLLMLYMPQTSLSTASRSHLLNSPCLRWHPGWRDQEGPGRCILFILAKISQDLVDDVLVFDAGESPPRERSECFGYAWAFIIRTIRPLATPDPGLERVAKANGFSLHAGVSCEGNQKDKREPRAAFRCVPDKAGQALGTFSWLDSQLLFCSLHQNQFRSYG